MGRVRRAVGGGSAAAAMLVIVGCGQGSDEGASDLEAGRAADLAATPGYLVEVVDHATAQPYRFEMSMDVEGRGRTVEDVPLFSGEFDGERTRVLLDRGRTAEANANANAAALGDLPPGVEPDDLVMEVITGPETMYMRAPFFRAVLAQRPVDGMGPEGYAELVHALADGWVSVDLAALGGVDPEWGTGALAGDQSLDPSAYLDLVRSAGSAGSAGSVEEVGSDEIDGVPVTRLAADVDLVDLLRLRGIEPSTTTSAAAEALSEVTLPVEAWIDGRGRIRRVRVVFDMDVVTTALADAGALPARVADRVDGSTLTQTLDLHDHGDETIDVADLDDAVDMTEPFANLCRSEETVAGTPRVPRPPFPPFPGDLPSFDDVYAGVLAEEAAMAAEMDARSAELDELLASLDDIPDVGPLPEPLPPPPEIPPELMEPPPPPPTMPEIIEVPPELMEPPPPPPPTPPTLPPDLQ